MLLQVQLPSDEWQWETAWTVDMSGAVAPNAPGTAGGGWESCPRKLKGTEVDLLMTLHAIVT